MQRFKKPLIITSVLLLVAGQVLIVTILLQANKPLAANQVLEPVVKTEKKPPTASELLTLVNAERSGVGVAPLVVDERLNKSAQQKADDMFKNKYNAHVDANGRHGYDIAHEYAPDICILPSENLYWGSSIANPNTSQGAVKWWIRSRGHHEAMIDATKHATGFGISGDKVVQHFC